ncbi:MAG: hypothetical protein ACE5DM_03430 [Candidatus Nanoarchaeia archaeon]
MAKKRSSKRGSAKAHSKKSKSAKKKPLKKATKKSLKQETFIRKIEEELKHEEALLTRRHKGKYQIPIGVRVLIGYLGFMGILYIAAFFSNITYPTTLLFGQIITGTWAVLINLAIVLLLAIIIRGLIKREAYTFDLALVWFGAGILNSILSFILLKNTTFSVLGDFLYLSFITIVVVDSLVIWYLLHEKKYFHSRTFHERPWHHRDKVFVYILVAFWVLVLLIGISYGLNFYGETTRMVDQTVVELSASQGFFAEDTCLAKEGKEKDVCLVVLATMYNSSDINQISKICKNIDSDFYRFTCLRTIR